MAFRFRTIIVGIFALAAVVGIFVIYSRVNQTDEIDLSRRGGVAENLREGDDTVPGQLGRVGDVEIGTVRKAKYKHLNENKELDRVFGFEELLAESGNRWVLKGPYLDLFRSRFICKVSADRGELLVEDTPGGPNPKEGKLSGNVTIRISPQGSGDVKRSTIYLDNISFISNESKFSTDGPVRFVSESARLKGRGLRLIYNNQQGRIEYLRILQLDSLRLPESKTPLLAKGDGDNRPVAETGKNNNKKESRVQAPEKAETLKDDYRQRPEQKKGDYYNLIFSRNVFVDTSKQYVLAEKKLSINNFLLSQSPQKKEEKEISTADTSELSTAPVKGKAEKKESTDTSIGREKSESSAGRAVVVKCDNGLMLSPVDSNSSHPGLEESVNNPVDDNLPEIFKTQTRKPKIIARNIRHSVPTGTTVLSGLVRLTFSPNSLTDDQNSLRELEKPVEVTAREQARYLPGSNQVIFEDDVKCKMVERLSESVLRSYTLSAGKLTLDLLQRKGGSPAGESLDIRRLTAEGDTVRLAALEKADGKLLSGTELKCRKFDYEPSEKVFTADGPGVIKAHDSKGTEPNSAEQGVSFNKPYWAVVKNFETLKYFSKDNVFQADAPAGERLDIRYVPVLKGGYGRLVRATVGNVKGKLQKNTEGENRLSTVEVTGGVRYKEGENQFSGSDLFFDADKSIITVNGDEFRPCELNGTLVDGIKYNLQTGEIKAEVIGPGAF